MTFLEKIKKNAQTDPKRIAYRLESERYGGKTRELTWGELDEYSDNLALWLDAKLQTKLPVVVYGHKSPWMLVSFLAVLKSGRAYCPIDTSVPGERVRGIVDSLDPELVLVPEEGEDFIEMVPFVGAEAIIKCATTDNEAKLSVDHDPEDLAYLIYTSGSTGTPKGVQITVDCLDNFISWGLTLGEGIKEGEKPVFLNQAPFSFDLSVMDLYLSLYSGGTLVALDKMLQGNMKSLLATFERSGAEIWVSTPSFANVCLTDPKFSGELLPKMKRFLFCGETLPNATVTKLHAAFPKAEVINTYGPTESTVAVTGVTVTKLVNEKYEPLPVGSAKPGTKILIFGEDGSLLKDGDAGEIIIVGNTVSPGYRNNEEQTKKAFFVYNDEGVEKRAYHTGDKGYLKDGQLFYMGRIDLQIKLHGYRIELEDIENNLMKLSQVSRAAVLPNYRNGEVRSLTAYVVEDRMPEDSFKEGQRLRSEAQTFLPDYMIPKKFVFVESLPMTNNGKTDRKALAKL